MPESNQPAAELGILRNMLYKWKEQLGSKGDEAFLKQAGRPLKEVQSEVLTLKQENHRLSEEVEVFKNAAVYFAKELN
jgi:transposase